MPIFESFISTLSIFLNTTTELINTNSSFSAYTNILGSIYAYLGFTYSNIANYNQYYFLRHPFLKQ
ncbi:hypothetical protein CC78DRAFT_533541 [Lojkania enalia]|uniref:Uncharacterized protein n=1 Tax=Lojkania enalia TaxID=147567 RepID=A0A9P4MZT5_9PLEO|nr:hypothetical protein CC78DRAFT_533541 [Didymosphaeria enalia]